MAKRTLRILHLSDLHIGKEQAADAWRVERVMGAAWRGNLAEIRADGPIDLVCFTGDIAQSGNAGQYADAARLIDLVLASLDCPRDRFFCVPGNHDVDRSLAPDAWEALRKWQWHNAQGLSQWMAGARPPFGFRPEWRDAIVSRQQAYRDFLVAAGLPHLLPGQAGNPHPTLGYRRALDLGLGAPLHIIGFDSAWLAGDDHDMGNLRLTDDQLGRLLHGADGKPLPGWCLGLMHHPVTDLADAREVQRQFGECGLGLLLHGHQHDPVVERRADPQGELPIFAAGCLYEHQRYPNGLLLVDVELPDARPLRPRQVWARKWSHRRAEWIDDDELYRGTRNGRLPLVPNAPQSAFATPTPGRFVGRDDERDLLRVALLPAAAGLETRPTALCCAIAGMPGVGKTRLAEEFVANDWREALGLPVATPLQDLCARLVLSPDDRRGVEDLASAILAGYGRNAPVDQAVGALRALLLSGPGGRRLLLVENVDAPAQAGVVAALVARLAGCAVLATGRYRDLAGDDWERVPVDPLPHDKAIELLRSRAALGRRPHPLTNEEAAELVRRLGHLPLALHIAGSHLGRGLGPQRFVEQLEAHRLALGPAAAGDAARDSDAARGIIASAFSISWDQWCKVADPARQEALVALAHGPAEGVGDTLGAAITVLEAADYEDCTLDADGLSLLDVEYVEQEGAPLRRVRLHPLIAEFLRHQPAPDAATVIGRIGAWCDPLLRARDEKAMPDAWAALRADTPALLHWLARAPQPSSAGAVGIGTVLYAQSHGPYEDWLRAIARWVVGCTNAGMLGTLRLAESRLSRRAGDPARSEAAARAALQAFQQGGLERSVAIAQGQIADLLLSRGEVGDALRILREEQMPAYERLGDERSLAVTQGRIADILRSRGKLEEALRIRREEQMPVYERLGDVRLRAITQGKIADILQARSDPGDLDEALRIRREEQMPVYERLGDMRELAITQGKIADTLFFLYLRGGRKDRRDLDEVLRIRREEELPVYERLGDVHSRAITQGKIAEILQLRGELDEALRIRREEQMPVYERQGDVLSLLVGRANLALNLHERGHPGDRVEIRRLLDLALVDAERLRLPMALIIRDWIARIFGADAPATGP